MRRWKKTAAAALALCALVLAGALSLSASASPGNVNLMAVNERVLLDLTADNMPRTVGGVLYVPYTMLSYQATGIDLGVNAMYSTTKRTLLVTDGQLGVVFDTRANTAQDLSGAAVSAQAMVRNGTVFVPIDWLCDYFGTISCTRTSTRHGTLIRLTSSSAILSDRSFVSAADNQLADSLSRYLESGGRGEGENPVPSGGAEASEPPSGGELYLALRWGDEGEECARLAEGRGLRVLFLFTPEQLRAIAGFAGGDARTALNTLEMAVLNGEIDAGGITVTAEGLSQCISRKSLLYDKKGEEHYNLISALHKSMRNSDPDAAVYWLARMLEAGEDPLYVARRVVRFASEDVGLADPQALQIAVAAYQACHFLGMPECNVHLSQAVIYVALAPKSNAMEEAYNAAKADAIEHLAEPVPLVIRNGVTGLMRDLDYGKGYQYAHDTEEKLTNMQCLPDALLGREYYRPAGMGQEAQLKQRLQEIKEWKKEHGA